MLRAEDRHAESGARGLFDSGGRGHAGKLDDICGDAGSDEIEADFMGAVFILAGRLDGRARLQAFGAVRILREGGNGGKRVSGREKHEEWNV